MEKTSKKGFFRAFIYWLNHPDEEEIVNGELNIKAFKDEDAEVIEELKNANKKANKMGNAMFTEKEKKRKETVKGMKAKVETPSMEKTQSKEQHEMEYEEPEQ